MPFGGSQYRLIGQAGVWAVASQCALRGHNVWFPGVDEGCDLRLDNGLKLQVKTSKVIHLTARRHPMSVYHFDLRKDYSVNGVRVSSKQYGSYKEHADFFILWGIDEDRFWIVPTSIERHILHFQTKGANIGGISGSASFWREVSEQKSRDHEDRWDMLDLNRIIETVEPKVQIPHCGPKPKCGSIEGD